MHDPIAPTDRLGSLDAMRGVAVLGILAMNIRNFALPLGEFDNPRWPRGILAEGTTTSLAPADFWSWLLTNALLEDKMITIFGLLFGAGVAIMGDRAAVAAPDHRWRPASLHYRRMFWLLLIGLAHAYLLWYGDILNTYALCGMLLWPMRRLKPGLLIGLGCMSLLACVWIREAPALIEMLSRQPGAPPPTPQPSLIRAIMARASQAEHAAYRGSWLDLFLWRADMNTAWHVLAGATFSVWRSLAHMLIGMGLLRLGLLAGSCRVSALAGIILAGYGFGLTLTLLGMVPGVLEVLERGPDLSGGARALLLRLARTMRFLGSLGVALGHVGLVLALWNWAAGRTIWPVATVRRAFESVGRMALTNYLTHTVVCVLVFDGWAGGQWDRWHMAHAYLLVAAIWIAQLIVSPLWLRWYRYGPVEWVWRSLTYCRVQPMRAPGRSPELSPREWARACHDGSAPSGHHDIT